MMVLKNLNLLFHLHIYLIRESSFDPTGLHTIQEEYLKVLMALQTLKRVLPETGPNRFITHGTAAVETPAKCATSSMVTIVFHFCKRLHGKYIMRW